MTINFMDDPVIYCHRCLRPGAVTYKGWQLLCPRCIKSDEEWYDD